MAQQALPDPDFPTVTFPNPEEGPGVLDLAFATAEEQGVDLVLANDPDADRFAAAERDSTTGAAHTPVSMALLTLLLLLLLLHAC